MSCAGRPSGFSEIPLREIFLALGSTANQKDPRFNWDTPAGRISTSRDNPAQWYNHDQSRGGGGAIDLAMHLSGFGFKQAVSWLAARFSAEMAVSSGCADAVRRAEEETREALRVPAPSEIPAASSASIGAVKDYLVNRRALPKELVEQAIAKGVLFAASYGRYVNAAFKLAPPEDLDGDAVGVELRGIGETPYHGVRGRKGVFRVGRGQCRKLAVCESAIEAMSYFALHGRPGLWVIGTAGDSGAGIELAGQLAARGVTIVAAQNPDKAGERQARTLLKALPGAIRHRPREAKDWNDLLRLKANSDYLAATATPAPEHAERPVPDDPLFVLIANRWVWARKPEQTAITDHKDFLVVHAPASEAIRYALKLAAARWKKVSVRGSVKFRRAAWRQAALMGIELAGYSPDQNDRIWLQKRPYSAQHGETAVAGNAAGLRGEKQASPAPLSDSGPGTGDSP